MKTCTTHHRACDCREQELRDGLEEIAVRLKAAIRRSGSAFEQRTLEKLNDLWRKLYGEDLIK